MICTSAVISRVTCSFMDNMRRMSSVSQGYHETLCEAPYEINLRLIKLYTFAFCSIAPMENPVH